MVDIAIPPQPKLCLDFPERTVSKELSAVDFADNCLDYALEKVDSLLEQGGYFRGLVWLRIL